MNLCFGPLLVPLILAFGHLLETRAFAPGRTPPGTFLNKAAGATGRGSSSSWAWAAGKPRLPLNAMTAPPKGNHNDTSDVLERLRWVENNVYEQVIEVTKYGADVRNLAKDVTELQKEAKKIKEELKNEAKEIKEELSKKIDKTESKLQNEAKEIKEELKNEAKEIKEEVSKKIDKTESKLQNEAKEIKEELQKEAKEIKEELKKEAKEIKEELSKKIDKATSKIDLIAYILVAYGAVGAMGIVISAPNLIGWLQK